VGKPGRRDSRLWLPTREGTTNFAMGVAAMNIDELDLELGRVVKCVDFDSPKDRRWCDMPDGMGEYKNLSFIAAKGVFDEPASILCGMALSKILNEIKNFEGTIDALGENNYTGNLVLYWRMKPCIDESGGFFSIYCRYGIVAEYIEPAKNVYRSISND